MNMEEVNQKELEKEQMILVLMNMRRLGSRYEKEIIDKIIELIENS